MDDTRFQALLKAAAGLGSFADGSSSLEQRGCLSFFRLEKHFAQKAELTPDELGHIRKCVRCRTAYGLFQEYFSSAVADAAPGQNRFAAFRVFAIGFAAAAAILLACFLWSSLPIRIEARLEGVPGETTRSGVQSLDSLTMLQSGDRFRIAVTLNKTAFVYLFIYDSAGGVQLMHPSKETLRYQAGAHLIPSPPAFYTLDENRGMESVLVFAVRHPVEDSERLVVDLRAAAARSPGDRSQALNRMRDVLSPMGGTVTVVTFRHG